VGGSDGSIRLWDLTTLKEKTVVSGFSDEVNALSFSKDGSLLVGSSFDGQVRVWGLRSGAEPRRVPVEFGLAHSFAISPSGTDLVTTHGEGVFSRMSLWDLATGEERIRLPGCVLGNNTLTYSPDGRTLASGDKDNKIRLRDASTGKILATLDDGLGWVKTIAFSPDGRRMAFGGKDGCVRFRDVPPAVALRSAAGS
jgi:WD40 repeat protein